MERSGIKTVVFCRQSTYKFSMCFDHYLPFHGDLKNPSIRGFESGHYLFSGSGPVALGPAKHWPRALAGQFPGR